MYVKVRVWKSIQMGINMKVISKRVKLMVKGYITGLMVKFMTVSGKMESKKVMECGRVSLAILIWDNGKTVKPMAMEFISGKMVIDSKALG